MLIALDYDKTYTADPELWDAFIKNAVFRGHKVICITMRRYPEEQIKSWYMEIVYTDRKAKKKYAETNGYAVDIWIDDKPAWILEDHFAP